MRASRTAEGSAAAAAAGPPRLLQTTYTRGAALATALLMIALVAEGASGADGEEEGRRAWGPCLDCHRAHQLEDMQWENWRAGLAAHPAANGIVVGLDAAERRAIARYLDLPGTPRRDEARAQDRQER